MQYIIYSLSIKELNENYIFDYLGRYQKALNILPI